MPIASNGSSDMFLPQPWDINAFTSYCQGENPSRNFPEFSSNLGSDSETKLVLSSIQVVDIDRVIDYYGGNQTPNGPNLVGTNIVWSNGKLVIILR